MFSPPVSSSPRTTLDFFQSKSASPDKELSHCQEAEHQIPSTAIAAAFVVGQESAKMQTNGKSIDHVHVFPRHTCTMTSSRAFRASRKQDSPPLPPRRNEKTTQKKMVAGWKDMCILPLSDAQRELNARSNANWKGDEIRKSVSRSPPRAHDAQDLNTANRYPTLHQSGKSHGLRTQQSLCEPSYHWITSNTALSRSVHSATVDSDQLPRNAGTGSLSTSLHATRAARHCNTYEKDKEPRRLRTHAPHPEHGWASNASQHEFSSSDSLASKGRLSDRSFYGSPNDEGNEIATWVLRRSPSCRTKPPRVAGFLSQGRCLPGRSLHLVPGHHTSSRVDPPERLAGLARRDLNWTVDREGPRRDWSNDSLSRPSCPTRELSSMSDSSADTIESFCSFA